MHTKIDKTLEHILFLARHFNKSDVRYIILILLMELNVPTKCIGFELLAKGISLCVNEPSAVLINGLYYCIAKQCSEKVSEEQIEQAIRAAIKIAWKHRDLEIWGLYFLSDEGGDVVKPSNYEFITRIARLVELWKGCCKDVSGKEGSNE